MEQERVPSHWIVRFEPHGRLVLFPFYGNELGRATVLKLDTVGWEYGPVDTITIFGETIEGELFSAEMSVDTAMSGPGEFDFKRNLGTLTNFRQEMLRHQNRP